MSTIAEPLIRPCKPSFEPSADMVSQNGESMGVINQGFTQAPVQIERGYAAPPSASQGHDKAAGLLSHWSAPGRSLVGYAAGNTDQKQEAENAKLQSKASTQLGKDAKWDKQTGAGTITVAGVTIKVLPDKTGALSSSGKGAETGFELGYTGWSGNFLATGQAKSVTAPKVTITIQTTYKAGVDPGASSAYGRGTTDADKTAGDTTLRFHEGSHGADFIRYIIANRVPVFAGKAGMTKEDLNKAYEDYTKAMTEYSAAMDAYSKAETDCVGTKESTCAVDPHSDAETE